jgi:hypothetical protein
MLCDRVFNPIGLRITYNWLHMPTGKTGTNTTAFNSRADFLEHLNNWNRDVRWKYWEGCTVGTVGQLDSGSPSVV